MQCLLWLNISPVLKKVNLFNPGDNSMNCYYPHFSDEEIETQKG